MVIQKLSWIVAQLVPIGARPAIMPASLRLRLLARTSSSLVVVTQETIVLAHQSGMAPRALPTWSCYLNRPLSALRTLHGHTGPASSVLIMAMKRQRRCATVVRISGSLAY